MRGPLNLLLSPSLLQASFAWLKPFINREKSV